jgi:hypothetical protein
MRTSFIFAIACCAGVTGFSPVSTKCSSSSSTTTALSASLNRRHLLSTIASTVVASTCISPLPAFADVADGNALPESAEKFRRILSLKNDLPRVISRVKTASPDNPIDRKEWDNLSDYMRRIYKGGEDMKSFAKTGIYDPEKKKKADEDVKALQKFAQAGDGPISKEDAAGLADILKKCDLVLEDFFELLRDVPDEI